MTLDKQFLLSALPSCSFYIQSLSKKLFSSTRFFVKVDSPEKIIDKKEEYGISIDSRSIKKDEVFLALKGPSFDGHDFISDALSKGASALIIEEDEKIKLDSISKSLLENKPIITVQNSLDALMSLAKCWRSQFDIPVLGITGSVGKTTTKAMLEGILKASGISSFVSFKNQNNIIGLSINILNMKKEHKVAVFELGINEPGEMNELVDVLRPNIAAITALAHAHCGGLGSIGEIAKEKSKIFKHFTDHEVGVIPGDQILFSDAYYKNPVIKFGFKRKNQIQASKKISFLNSEDGDVTGIEATLKIYKEVIKVKLNIFSEAMINNVLAAVSLAKVLKVSNKKIVSGLENFIPVGGRFEKRKLKKKKGVLINDCYNASPESMKEALFAFEKMKSSGPKIAVLGDMLELGAKDRFWHRQIGRTLCKTTSFDNVILVGKHAKTIASTAPLSMKISCVSDWKEAQKSLDKLIDSNSLVLLKASNAVGLTNIVEHIS